MKTPKKTINVSAKKIFQHLAICVAGLVLSCYPLHAAPSPPEIAVSRIDVAPRLDGKLDDPCWVQAYTDKTWEQNLLPLPHEIKIEQMATIKPPEIALLIDTNAGPVQTQIYTELVALLNPLAKTMAAKAVFQIIIGIPDEQGLVAGRPVADAVRLDNCPNREQAYLIRPDGENRLVIAARHERGLYYGAQTLKQLLTPGITEAEVRIPLAVVTDWPDMEERGIWNTPRNSYRVMRYMSGLKLNYMTYVCTPANTTNAWPRPVMDVEMMARLRRHAMAGRVQMLHHLNYFDRLYGLYKSHPELMGQGEEAVCEGEHFKYAKRDIPVICGSQPLWRTIVADMLAALGEQGAPEVSVWLSEFKGQCQCSQCRDSNQTLLESRLVLDAWRSIRDKYPNMTLRIFYSQGDATPATDEALRELPPEVKIERVYSFYQPFWDAAKRGQWVMSFNGHPIALPTFGSYAPERIITPITNGFHAGLKGVLGCNYSYYGKGQVPKGYYTDIYAIHISARAEWSWNINGRTPRQFAEAWATRAGYDAPARFADWLEAITKINNLLILDNPHAHRSAGLPRTKGFKNQFANMSELIRERNSIGLYTPAALDAVSELCRTAEELAAPLNQPLPLAETHSQAALLQMYVSLNALSEQVKDSDSAGLRAAWAEYQSAVEKALLANERCLELWQGEPANYITKVQKEVRGQWEEAREIMDAAISLRVPVVSNENDTENYE